MVSRGLGTSAASSSSAPAACSGLPTATIITGTLTLRLKNWARERRPRAVPSTPRSADATAKPRRYSTSQMARIA